MRGTQEDVEAFPYLHIHHIHAYSYSQMLEFYSKECRDVTQSFIMVIKDILNNSFYFKCDFFNDIKSNLFVIFRAEGFLWLIKSPIPSRFALKVLCEIRPIILHRLMSKFEIQSHTCSPEIREIRRLRNKSSSCSCFYVNWKREARSDWCVYGVCLNRTTRTRTLSCLKYQQPQSLYSSSSITPSQSSSLILWS